MSVTLFVNCVKTKDKRTEDRHTEGDWNWAMIKSKWRPRHSDSKFTLSLSLKLGSNFVNTTKWCHRVTLFAYFSHKKTAVDCRTALDAPRLNGRLFCGVKKKPGCIRSELRLRLDQDWVCGDAVVSSGSLRMRGHHQIIGGLELLWKPFIGCIKFVLIKVVCTLFLHNAFLKFEFLCLTY